MMGCFDQVPDHIVSTHILSRILGIKTRIRFAAVCRSWRQLSDQAPPLPPAYVFTADTTYNSPFLFDPFAAAITPLPCPEKPIPPWAPAGFHPPYLAYSGKLLTNRPNMQPPCFPPFLIDPFSGKTLLRLPTMCRYSDGRRASLSRILHTVRFSSPHPSSVRPRLVAAIENNISQTLMICPLPADDHHADVADEDQSEWVVSLPINDDNDHINHVIQNFIFYKDDLYCITEGGSLVCVYDLHQHILLPNKIISSPAPRIIYTDGENNDREKNWPYNTTYELVDSGGDLLLVTRHDPYLECRPDVWFEVHRLDLEKGVSVRVDQLPHAMLFLGKGCSKSWPGPELELEPELELTNYPFFRKSYIYFFHKHCHSRYKLGRFPVGGNSDAAEFLPHRLPSDTQPMWISRTF